MELSCNEVPLYGQVSISAKFDKDIYLPEDAEFYFVYDGSMKRHIMFAERIGDNALQSLVPGHGCQEAVSVSVLMYARGSSPVALGSCPVTYRENLSCKLSRFLVSHTECVSATSHKVLLDKFGLTVKDLQSLDTDLTMAIAHEELPSTWSILGNCYEGALQLDNSAPVQAYILLSDSTRRQFHLSCLPILLKVVADASISSEHCKDCTENL